MSDPNMDQAATTGPAPDGGTGTPESKLTLGTAMVGGPVETGADNPAEPDAAGQRPVDPDSGQPVDGE